jgi:predicted dehydrogenase/threonine dehydrogenase-like Zn-dependent dehydrogenase
MKQIVQDLKNGHTMLEEIPAPLVSPGHILIKTHRSLVSLGTEKMLVEFGRGNLFSKARQQPEKVKQVFDKIKSEGLIPTLEAVFNKLDEPLPLGYCNAGEVVAIGDGVTEFSIGDRVASNGPHAEIVCMPKNLVARIPDNVSYEEAAFTVIGSIGLQGIRLVNPTMGETVVVIGLGLIGLITVQLLISNGCKVIGFDFDDTKVTMAKKFGIIAFNSAIVNPVTTVESLSAENGADAVLITASTSSNDLITQAAEMSRKRGRIVLIGVIGLNLKRADFYKKELTFQVSCSYGPGRYDENYEQNGIDYPLPFVRWTEKRNFEVILHAISNRRLDVQSLISERYSLNDYLQIYSNLGKGSIASILEYSNEGERENRVILVNASLKKTGNVKVGIIGAGNFTKMTLLPSMKKTGASYKYISSASGVTAKALAKKYGFQYCTSNYKAILEDSDIDLVMITTRHNLHAKMIIECLESGKNVFVEKPLAINSEEISLLEEKYHSISSPLSLNLGFNRRFSPFIQKAKKLIGEETSTLNMIATMNAGYIPPDVWVHDLKVGGGRIVGEACHFIDLMTFLSGSMVTEVVMSGLGTHPNDNTDNAIITLRYANGAQGVINYFSNGSKAYSKERVELYTQGRTIVIDNFMKMNAYGFKNFSSYSSSIDKGHKNQFQLLIESISNGTEGLIPFNQLINTTKASLAALKSMKQKKWIKI